MSLQEKINNGYLYIPEGVHKITEPLVLDGWRYNNATSNDVKIVSHPRGKLVWEGPPHRNLFEVKNRNTVYNFAKVMFQDVTATSKVDGCSVVKGGEAVTPHHITFENCNFTASSAYCIDFNDCTYTITPVFRDMRTGGAGALRYKAKTSGRDMNHATSQMIIENWRHQGGNRIGPAFDLNGCGGLRMRQVIDEQRAKLHPDLIGVYKGPIGLRITNPIQPAYIDDYWFEVWSNWETEAPGCWSHEFRVDNSTGHNKQNYINARKIFAASAPGVKPIHVIGTTMSYPSNRHSIVVDFEDMWAPSSDTFEIKGMALVRVIRPWYMNGGESKVASMLELEKQLTTWKNPNNGQVYTDNSEIFIDPIRSNSHRPPRITREELRPPLLDQDKFLSSGWYPVIKDYETIIPPATGTNDDIIPNNVNFDIVDPKITDLIVKLEELQKSFEENNFDKNALLAILDEIKLSFQNLNNSISSRDNDLSVVVGKIKEILLEIEGKNEG